MKALLFVPPGGYFAERWSQGHMMPALGIAYMAAVLEEDGHECQLIPSHILDMSWRDIGRKIEEERPDVVGVTTTTENRHLGFELAKVSKRYYSPATTILGGPHFNGTSDETLRKLPFIDVVVSGEGELTMKEIAQCMDNGGNLKDVKGISFRDDQGDIVHTPPRMKIPDLNDLPLPARHLEPWDAYNFQMDVPGKGPVKAANMMTSRGCPFTCTFCATPGNWGRKVRGLTAENVIMEIEHLIDNYDAEAIWFYDDTLNYNPKRLHKICDMIIERNLDINWYCELRVDLLKGGKATVAKMAEAGLYYAGFGIESANERICKEIVTKRANLQQAYNFINWCNEFDVIANPFFIFSHPTETWEEAQETIAVIEDLKDRADTSVAISHVYPGTELEQRSYREGVLPEDFSWVTKRDRRVIFLPEAQGHAPLYVDKLSWWQISELLFRFSMGNENFSVWNKIPKVLFHIRSLGDVRRYAIMAIVFLRLKIQNWLGKAPSMPAPKLSEKASTL